MEASTKDFKQQKYLGKYVLTGMEKHNLTWIGQLAFLEKVNAQFDWRERPVTEVVPMGRTQMPQKVP